MGAGNCERRKCAQIGGVLGSRQGKPGKRKAKEVTETLQWNPVGWRYSGFFTSQLNTANESSRRTCQSPAAALRPIRR
jgi:hypothetical protein